MITYATATDWVMWSDSSTTQSPTLRQVQAANLTIGMATRHAIYANDQATGLPADPVLADAMRNATIWQIDALLNVDKALSSTGAGALGPLQSASIDGASYTIRAPADVRAEYLDPATGLASQAAQILAAAGLTSGPVGRIG